MSAAPREEVSMTQPRPVPLRPLGVAEILDGAVRLFRANAQVALAVSIPLGIVRTGLVAVILYATFSGDQSVTALVLLGEIFVSALLGTIVTGLLAPLFSSALLGIRLTGHQAVSRVRGRVFALILLGLVVAVAQEAGVVALVVGGVWLWGVWAVAAPALVLERTGVVGALRRSSRLVRTAFWRTIGIRSLRWVLTGVLGLFVTLPFELLADYLTGTGVVDAATDGTSQPALYVTILCIGRLLAVALMSPISAAVDVLIYTDLRMRAEGMDIVLALPQPGTAATGQPGAGQPRTGQPGTGQPSVTAW
jgi:hypothetical protein